MSDRDQTDRSDPSDQTDHLTTETQSRARLADVALWRGLQRELRLSEREIQVAIRLVLGDSVRQIAARLGISVYTVLTYQRRLKDKCQVQHRNELVTKLLLASGLLLGE